MAFLFILALPYLLLPLYDKGSGVAITSLRPNSSVHGGASGLQEGQLIYQINECSVKNTSDFHSCLQQEQKKSGTPPHYCVHLEEQLICPDCCSETKDNNGSHLAFKVGSKATFCLSVREVLSRKSKNCSPTGKKYAFKNMISLLYILAAFWGEVGDQNLPTSVTKFTKFATNKFY